MMKLYKRTDGAIRYHEAWCNEGTITEHWGIIGEEGESREHQLAEGEGEKDGIFRVLRPAAEQGFAPVDIEEHAVLLIEYAIEGSGTNQQLDKRQALQRRMDETLGWTGLGACDGGSTGSGTMEVCCYVVDFEIARRVIEADLQDTEFGDFTRLYREFPQSCDERGCNGAQG